MKRTTILGFAALLVGVGTVGCVDRAAQAQAKETARIQQDPVMPVVVEPVVSAPLSESMEITGQVTTSEDVAVGAKVPGRIVSVLVKDGDPVAAGGTIATQDTVTSRLQVQQATAMVSAARATLNQATSNAKISPSRTASAVASAEAQLRSAKAQLQKARKGAREEEKAQAANNVEAARSNMQTAKKDVERKRTLFADGAISRQLLDMSENAYQASLSQYENALQALRIAENAARPEDLESAQEAVRQAEEGVRSAKTQQRLDVLLDDQVQAAAANLRSAQSQLEMARQNVADAVIRSPFAGKIAGKPVQVGAVVGAGTPIAHVIGSEGAYFEGEVNENEISKVKLQALVSVRVDALEGRTFSGVIAAISPSGNEVGRIFRVRVKISGSLQDVKPGMFARGKILLRSIASAPVVPVGAIVQRNGEDHVFLLEGDKVKLQKISTGLRTDGYVQVFGLAEGVKIVVSGQNMLDDGVKVRVEKPNKDNDAGEAKL